MFDLVGRDGRRPDSVHGRLAAFWLTAPGRHGEVGRADEFAPAVSGALFDAVDLRGVVRSFFTGGPAKVY